jgi:anion-transporting  ArsA/GET3 family ATPase
MLGQAKVLIVAGKGGVGKTTLTAVIAYLAAQVGINTLIVELDTRSGVATAFGRSELLNYDEVILYSPDHSTNDSRGTVRARVITPDDALLEYLDDHGLKRVSKRLVSHGMLDIVATAIPGIKDILVLGKIKQLERTDGADLIVVDAPATGHAVTFLSSAVGLVDVAKSGPVRSQAIDVLEMLQDPLRCQVVLVTIPEEMPVNETIEAAFKLEDTVGVKLGPVIVNACYTEIEGLYADLEQVANSQGISLSPSELDVLIQAATFRRERIALQRMQLERLARELPIPQLRTPYVFSTEIGPAQIDLLAQALAASISMLER